MYLVIVNVTLALYSNTFSRQSRIHETTDTFGVDAYLKTYTFQKMKWLRKGQYKQRKSWIKCVDWNSILELYQPLYRATVHVNHSFFDLEKAIQLLQHFQHFRSNNIIIIARLHLAVSVCLCVCACLWTCCGCLEMPGYSGLALIRGRNTHPALSSSGGREGRASTSEISATANTKSQGSRGQNLNEPPQPATWTYQVVVLSSRWVNEISLFGCSTSQYSNLLLHSTHASRCSNRIKSGN